LLKNALFFFLCAVLNSQEAYSQNTSPTIETADSLFARARYEAAYPLYRQELRRGLTSPRVLLRMAYVQEGLGHYPAALYYLSLAHRRKPTYATWRKMTEVAQSYRLAGYPETWRTKLLITFRRYYYTILQGLLIGAVLVGVFLLVRHRASRSFWITYGLYLLGVGFYLNFLSPSKVGLVARPHAALMGGPSAGASWLTTARAGDRLLVRDQQDIWYRVEWRNRDAYIRRNDLLVLE
jgi:tetratricopeptide (TPR) repeat protein